MVPFILSQIQNDMNGQRAFEGLDSEPLEVDRNFYFSENIADFHSIYSNPKHRDPPLSSTHDSRIPETGQSEDQECPESQKILLSPPHYLS